MQTQNVVHVHLKKSGQHLYFGGIAAMFQAIQREDLGISKSRLYDRGLKQPYENDLVVIRKGPLTRKTGGQRGAHLRSEIKNTPSHEQ